MEDDVADVGWVADDGEDDVGLGGDGFGGVSPVSPEGEEGLGLGRGSGEDSESVAGLD